MPDNHSQDVMSDNSLQDDKKSLLSRSTDSAEVEGYTYELRDRRNYKNRYWHALHLLILYMLVIGTSTALVVMSYKVKDPTLAVYCAFSNVKISHCSVCRRSDRLQHLPSQLSHTRQQSSPIPTMLVHQRRRGTRCGMIFTAVRSRFNSCSQVYVFKKN